MSNNRPQNITLIEHPEATEDGTPKPFDRALAALQLDVSLPARIVAAILVKWANSKTGRCWPSVRSIAMHYGLPRTGKELKKRYPVIRRALRELDRAGAIRTEQSKGGNKKETSVYMITFDGFYAVDEAPNPELTVPPPRTDSSPNPELTVPQPRTDSSPNRGRREQGKKKEEGKGKRARGAPDPQAGKKRPVRTFEYPEAFETFWTVYPVLGRKGKRAALKAWQKLTPEDREKIIPALKVQVAAYHFAGRAGRQFVPHATTWINQGRWEDDIDHGSAGRTGSGTAPDSAPVEAAPPFDAATTEKLREEYAARNRTANLRNHIERLEAMLPKMSEGDAKRKDAARLAQARAELEALEGAAILETA